MFRNVQVYERYLVISQNAHASTRNIPCMFPPMTTKLFRRAPNPGSMRRATARFVKGAMATNFTSPVVKTGNVIIGNKIYQKITFPNCSQCRKPLLHHKINCHIKGKLNTFIPWSTFYDLRTFYATNPRSIYVQRFEFIFEILSYICGLK